MAGSGESLDWSDGRRVGRERARIEANLAALRLVHDLRESAREPSADERAVLGRWWRSWGAVPKVFDELEVQHADTRAELARWLGRDGYVAARRTVLNAHYTAPGYAQAMWGALAGLGFAGGNVLEPGCGAGVFLGSAPADTRVTGVELDPTTAFIARARFPEATVRTESFADSPFADDTFDAVIGNVPFADVTLHDPVHNRDKLSMHNHFIVKSLDLTRPGGVVAVLTSRWTLDAAGEKARQAMQDRADFLGAVRLPAGAHRIVAGTDAITDLVLFRKRALGEAAGDDSWVHASSVRLPNRDGDLVEVSIGSWFTEHPETVLGELSVVHGQYAEALTVIPSREGSREGSVAEQFAAACSSLVERVNRDGKGFVQRSVDAPVIDPGMVVEPVARAGSIDGFDGHLSFDGDQWRQVRSGRIEPLEVPASQQRQLRDLVGLRDATVALLDAEAASMEDTEQIAALRAGLNTRYEAYVDRFGPVNTVKVTETSRLDKHGDPIVSRRYPPAMRTFRTDPHRAVVCALEHYDERTGTATKAAIFTGRVVAPRVVPTSVESPADALAIVLDTHGRVDLDHVASLLDVDTDVARERLGDLVFADPADDMRLVPAAAYLSGDVRQALRVAQEAVQNHPERAVELAVNVAALEKVVPEDLGPEDITARLGAVWIPERDVRDFLAETLDDARVSVVHAGGSNWKVTGGNKHAQAAVADWGTERMNALTLAERLMQQKRIVVIDVIDDGDTQRRVVNPVETEAAKAKAEAMQAAFGQWLWEDPARRDRLLRAYNDTFNNLALRDYTADGERLSLPGLASSFTPHPHQRSAVARMISEPAVGLYHGVGAGKTAEMVMGAMELGRLGLVSKPAVVVPNHMLEQVTREWLQLYPQANVLAAGSEDLRGDGRRMFIARAATGQWDGIVMTQGAFGSLAVSGATERAYMDRELSLYRDQLSRMREADTGGGMTVKRMEKMLVTMEEKLEAKLDRPRDEGVTFEQTGIDYLLIDELHMYKNLTIVSNIDGVARDGAQRATDLDMKIDYLRQRAETSGRPARVLTGATATPIANSMAEAYVMQRYLRPDLLEKAGITDFDAWAATFGESVTELEMAPEGGSFRPKTRFAQFNNLPELLSMWHVSADVKTSRDLQLNVPDLVERGDGVRAPETVVVEQSEDMVEVMSWIGYRAEMVRSGAVPPEEDNMLKISSDGRKAALDLRLLTADDAPVNRAGLSGQVLGEPGLWTMNKLDVAAARIHGIWRDNLDREYLTPDGTPHPTRGGFQIVFCDLGTPNDGWNVYDQLRDKLTEHGMDSSRVRFVHDANTDAKKDRLFAECRGGGVDVLIGSTAKMGVGTNIQTRAVALHHLDCPWRPADVEQREGRIIRQGNQNPEVQMLRYVTEGSFDGYMWQTVERKQRFIEQVMHGSLDVRNADDIGSDNSLNYSEVKALASGNPLLLEKAQADQELAKLRNLESAHRLDQRRRRSAVSAAEHAVDVLDVQIPQVQAAIEQRVSTKGDTFRATVDGRTYEERAEAAVAVRGHIVQAVNRFSGVGNNPSRRSGVVTVGGHTFDLEYRDSLGSKEVRFAVQAAPDTVATRMTLEEATANGHGLITRLENAVTGMETVLDRLQQQRVTAVKERDTAQAGIGQPFEHADALTAARDRVTSITEQMEATGREPDDDPTPDNNPDQETSQETNSRAPGHDQVEQPEQQRINRDGVTKLRETLAQLRGQRDETPDASTPRPDQQGQHRYPERRGQGPSGPSLT